ncbi:MAG: hypothetical protein K0S07_1434 [Chlamydiales bacterium]|jgi:hypothetical protein|nr:hypothetical protein [Chlamydiales bacterium]
MEIKEGIFILRGIFDSYQEILAGFLAAFLILAVVYFIYSAKSQRRTASQANCQGNLPAYSQEPALFEQFESADEEIVRAQWRRTYFINLAAGLFCFMSIMTFTLFFKEGALSGQSLAVNLGFYTSRLLFGSGLIYLGYKLTYYCDYQKRGTRLLLFSIVTWPFIVLNAMANFSPIEVLLSLIYLFHWVNNIRLYRVNWKRQRQLVQALKRKYNVA